MVLLTYQETDSQENVIAAKESVCKNEGPKTAYIDKLYAFNEEYADEERCDLFFICQDGEIPAHRLVISNASKYIMAMQDDQSPWYPVYISVPDLTKEMVNTLVRLAYTGQMNIPPGITSDELLDAMQALGWVHTDCLTATYLDTSGSVEEEFGASVSSKTAESLETVLKMKFPVAPKEDANTSDDDEEMEMALPDVPVSDDDEGKLQICTEPTKRKEVTRKRTRQTKQSKVPTPSKKKSVTPDKGSPPAKAPAKRSDAPSNTRKGSRKSNEDTTNTSLSKDIKESEGHANSVDSGESSEPLRSRTRTIRKPKKFDDLIVLTPTKRKDSPTKSPSKPAPKSSKTSSMEKETTGVMASPRKSRVSKKVSNDVNLATAGSKGRRSTSSENKDAIRNSLITSYFNKRSPRKSNDNDTASLEANREKTPDSAIAEANNVQNNDEDTDGISKTGITETADDSIGKNSSNNAATTRKRARSTASTKSDKEKETAQDETVVDGEVTEASTRSRRKKTIQDTTEIDSTETLNPTKRGRKSSTISNASKASNKDVKESVPEKNLDLEDGDNESPRTRRSR